MRKRALIIAFFVVASVLFALVLLSKSKPGKRVEWYTLNRDAVSVMNAAGFNVIEIASMGSEEIPVPLLARIGSYLPGRAKIQLSPDEIEPTTLRIVARRSDHTSVRCLARYHDGYIAVIVLRYRHGWRQEASDLGDVLRSAYPHERIELEEDRRPDSTLE